MTIGDSDLFNLQTEFEDLDTASNAFTDDESIETIQFLALTMLGIMVVSVVGTIYRSRNEIGDNWKWSRQQSPSIQDSLLHMAKSAYQAGCIQLEIHEWEQTLTAYQQKRGEASRVRLNPVYSKMRSSTTDHVLKAEKKVVRKIFSDHIKEGKILEVGANELAFNGKSYLCQLAPKAMRRDFVFSDMFTPESLNESQRKTYRQLDLTNISDQLDSEESFSNIVALSVLDTIARNQLPKVAQELSKALKLGGRVIVLSDLLFDQGPFAEKHSEGDNFIIPMIEKDFIGGKVISIQKLKARAKAFGMNFVNFLDNLLKLKPTDRFNFLMFTQHQSSLSLVPILGAICSPADYKTFDHKSSYIEDLRSAFINTGQYTIIEEGYQSDSAVADGVYLSPSRYGTQKMVMNNISVDVSSRDFVSFSTDPAVAHGKSKLTSTIFAMVVEKTE